MNTRPTSRLILHGLVSTAAFVAVSLAPACETLSAEQSAAVPAQHVQLEEHVRGLVKKSAALGKEELDYAAIEDVELFQTDGSQSLDTIVNFLDTRSGKGDASQSLSRICAIAREQQEEASCMAALKHMSLSGQEDASDFLEEMVEQPYLTDEERELAETHRGIATFLAEETASGAPTTQQFLVDWVEDGYERGAFIIFSPRKQRLALVKFVITR